MSGQKTITRTLVAAVGALLMSSVMVGSAIAPATVAYASTQTSANAAVNIWASPQASSGL